MNLETNIEQKQKRKYKKSTIINESIAKNKPKSDNIYVDKAKFYEALVQRKLDVEAAIRDNKPAPKISNYVGDCIQKICTNLAKKYQFSGYHYKDDMIADAVVHCLKYIDSFDISVSENPFSYFTQAAYYQFLARIEDERKQTYIKCKSTLNSTVLDELSEHLEDRNDNGVFDNLELDTEFYDSFVKDYEDKITRKSNALKESKKQRTKTSKLSQQGGLF